MAGLVNKHFCLWQKSWRTPSRSEAFRSATARRAALSAEMAEFTSAEHFNPDGVPHGACPVGRARHGKAFEGLLKRCFG